MLGLELKCRCVGNIETFCPRTTLYCTGVCINRSFIYLSWNKNIIGCIILEWFVRTFCPRSVVFYARNGFSMRTNLSSSIVPVPQVIELLFPIFSTLFLFFAQSKKEFCVYGDIFFLKYINGLFTFFTK